MPADASGLPISTLELGSYHESEEHAVWNEPEPRSRSQNLKFRAHGCVWWVRVTFSGTVYHLSNAGNARKKKPERRKEFQEFVKSINYYPLPLLNDTVTEVILTLRSERLCLIKVQSGSHNEHNVFINHATHFDCEVREEPLRVIYPLLSEFPTFKAIDISRVENKTEIADDRVFRVRLRDSGEQEYIYKTVDRPFYKKADTEAIRKELENLEYFRNAQHIVQSAGVVVSPNPYMTSRQDDKPLVITGILLEYYCGGSLEQILSEHRLKDYGWQRWPLQVGAALSLLHDAKRTHMDVKLSNVVCDEKANAFLIDISGIGGVTYSWLAPEMRCEAPDESFRARQLNDTWAYGKMLHELASYASGQPFATQMQYIAGKLMSDDPYSRMSLSVAVTQLRQFLQRPFHV
jgi:serine/threonine protein kinase